MFHVLIFENTIDSDFKLISLVSKIQIFNNNVRDTKKRKNTKFFVQIRSTNFV